MRIVNKKDTLLRCAMLIGSSIMFTFGVITGAFILALGNDGELSLIPFAVAGIGL